MTRPTLKLPKPADPSARSKSPTSRARRAQQGKARVAPAAASLAEAATRTEAPSSGVPADRSNTPSSGAPEARSSTRPYVPVAASGGARPRVPAAPASPAPTPARPRAPRHENPEDPRLSKRMSELGLCSRREADQWIEKGWVKVDGKVVNTLGVRVSPRGAHRGRSGGARHQSEQVTILLHKPVGYVSGQAEDGYEPAVVLIRPENRWADDPSPLRFRPGHLRGLAPAGRLDIDSTGLLVFTQDGRIAKQLIGQDSAVEKEYLVRVEGELSDEGMKRCGTA